MPVPEDTQTTAPTPEPSPEQPPKDFRKASPAEFREELAKYGIKARWNY